MSVRSVWIVNAHEKQSVKLLFSRSYQTVEKRAKSFGGKHYIQIPGPDEFAQDLFESLGLGSSSHAFSSRRDTCKRIYQKPVYEVKTVFGDLWPVVVFEQSALLYCCLPLVENLCNDGEKRPPIVSCPGISAGFSLLLGMAEFLGSLQQNISPDSLKFADLYLYLSEAAPFGTPADINANNVRLHLKGKVPGTAANQGEKIPAWRPIPHRGKSSLSFTVKEKIRAFQYDNTSIKDALEVYGTVMCNAEVEGVMPEVTVLLDNSGEGNTALLDIATHPCVQAVETGTKTGASGRSQCEITKLTFTPPTEKFPLCHYTAKFVGDPPIQAYYQMKGETTVDILIQLKLSSKIKNAFEYCELQLPFFNRGPILTVDSSPSHGTVLIAPDKKTLVWDIGQRFPSKSLEVLLKASLQFGDYSPDTTSQKDDVFCTGSNTYAQLLFKIQQFTLSGFKVDDKSVNILPHVKARISEAAECQSMNYKVWNSHGDAPIVFQPPDDFFSDT